MKINASSILVEVFSAVLGFTGELIRILGPLVLLCSNVFMVGSVSYWLD
jgi:hypothetical protein